MVLGISSFFKKLKSKAAALTDRRSCFIEISISILCGFLLVVTAFPEVAFLGANIRSNDLIWNSNLTTYNKDDAVNILPTSPHREFWHSYFDRGGSWIQSEPGSEFVLKSIQGDESLYWNPYSAAGAIGPETLVDNKFAVINWIYTLFGGGQRIYSLIFLASVWLAASCMHRFLRGVCSLSQMAAWSGAAFYILNGFSIANVGSNVAWSFYFVPPVLLACGRLFERPNPRRLILTAIAIACVMSFTFMPTTVINLLTVAVIVLCFLFSQADNKEKIKGLLSIFIAGVLAFCLVSALYLPIAENLLFDSSELDSYALRTRIPAHWTSFLSLFSSSHFYESYQAFYQPEYSAYHVYHHNSIPKLFDLTLGYHIGITAAFFSGFALVTKNQTKLHRLLICGSFTLMILSLACIFGLPGYIWLFEKIPIIGNFGSQYIWPSVMIPCTLLVAFGLNNLVVQKVTRRSLVVVLTVIWIVVLNLCHWVYIVGKLDPQWSLHQIQIYNLMAIEFFMVITTILIVFMFYVKKVLWKKVLSWSLFLLLSVNLISEFKSVYFVLPDFFEEERPELQFLDENADLYRIFGIGITVPVHPERGAAWGLYLIGSTNMSIIPEYKDFYTDNIELDPSQRFSVFLTAEVAKDTPELNKINTFALDLTGVKYIVLPDSYLNYATYWEEQGFVEAAYFPSSKVKIFENPNVWPRAFWLPPEYLSVESGSLLTPELRNVISTVNIDEYHHANLTMQGNAERDGIVVLTDNWHRNWTAMVNGEKAEIIKVHKTFRGVSVPAGDFEITMQYSPSTLGFALVLTVLGFVICLLGLFMPNRVWLKMLKNS